MAAEWPVVRIAEIAEKIAMGPFGSNIKVETFVADGVPVISGAHLHERRVRDGDFNFITPSHAERLKNSNVHRGDVIFTHAGTIGQVAYIPENSAYERYVISQRQFFLRCDRAKADPAFITYFFHSPEGRYKLLANASQVGVPSISRPSSNLKEIEIALPTMAEQREIVAALEVIEDRIDLLRQTNAAHEAIAQALYKSWFIDFDPVRAKADGREPEGIDAATAALFPASFVDSAIGAIPTDWNWSTLADLSDLNAASWSSRRAPTDIAYIDLAGVKANVFDAPQRYTFAEAPSRARRELRAGDTLVGTVRPGNRSYGFIAEAAPGLTGSTGFAVLSPISPTSAAFVYLCATRGDNIDRLAALADGGAYPAVRPDLVLGTTCAIPPTPTLEAFDRVASPMLLTIAANAQRIEVLADIRDTLLPRLISGKLRLPEAEAAIEAVA